MKYCLGLDLGVGSIGSAVLELDENNNRVRIVDAGVRIFEVSEGAETRRIKRTIRKNNIRTKKRLNLLSSVLFENGLWPTTSPDGTRKVRTISPYLMRKNALVAKLESPFYIGRIMLHLAKHRGAGFVSAAQEMEEEILDEGEISKKKKTSYDLMNEYLTKTGCTTLGEFFYQRLEEKKPVRQHDYALKNHSIDYAIPRYLVKDEFNQIWDKQAVYYPQMQKDGLKQTIYDILFYEKSPAPYATGKCIYFENEDRLLKAHPLSEMRRIYEEVNNIRLETDVARIKLNTEQRNLIVNELLLKGKNAGRKAIKSVLGLNNQIQISLDEDRIIKAYLYATPLFQEIDYIRNLSQEELEKFIDFLANPIKDPDNPNSRLLNEDELIKKLKPILHTQDEKKIAFLLTKLPKGRAMLGKTATKIILEMLKNTGLSHREVTEELSKTDPRFMAEEERARQTQGTCSALPYYGAILRSDTQVIPPLTILHNKHLNADEVKYGRVANPAVHMILNQLRKVVNEIIKIYGKPNSINIELGRDVGMSTKRKKQFELEKRQNEVLNEEAKKYLQEHRIFINSKNILKYKLAKEQGWVDAYNPVNKIGQYFTGFEIEHIIPRAKGGSDTYSNLCLVNRNDNNAKGDRFAYDYFEATRPPEIVKAILDNARSRLPESKSWRFESDASEKFDDSGDEDETNRYLTDTRYVSKLAARYLRTIIDCKDVMEANENRILPVRGTQTATVHGKWNLLGLEYDLMGINVPRYVPCLPYWIERETGEICEGSAKPDIDGNWRFYEKKCNPEWSKKPRIDHRHHAMDAITVACLNRSLIQKMSNEVNLERIEYPLPMKCVETVAQFRQYVIDVLKHVKVSHKPNHTKDGEFHKETGRVVLCENPNNKDALITVYKRKVMQAIKSNKDLKKLLVPDMVKDEWNPNIPIDREKQQKLKDDFELYSELAKAELNAENEQFLTDGKKEIPVLEARILQRAFRIIQNKGLYKNDSFKQYESNSSLIYIKKHGLAYEGGNNHCIDFYQKDGKVGWEVIKRFDANQKDFVPKWKQDGAKLIWSIQQGDLLELDTPAEWASYTDQPRCLARVKKFSVGKCSIDYFTDARMTSPKNKNLKYMFVDTLDGRGLSFYINSKARKVELTPFGKMKRKHKVLWNGTKATP